MKSISILLGVAFLFAPIIVDGQDECTPEETASSQLVAGISAEVIADVPVAVHSDASTSTEHVAQLPPETSVYVITGPQCDGSNIWWQVEFDRDLSSDDRYFGWVQEFENTTRQINPLIPTLDTILLPPNAPISSTNLSQISLHGEMEPFGDLLQFVWSRDCDYLAINTLRAVWVYPVTAARPNTMPFRLPRIASSFWNKLGSIAFNSDGQKIATVGIPDGNLHLWSQTGAEQKVLYTSVSDYAGVAAIAPDLSKWAIAHDDGTISIWDVATGAILQSLTGHSVVGAIAFTPDGTTLISLGGFPYTSIGDKDNSVRIWDIATGQPASVLSVSMPPPQRTGDESRIAIAADGKTAAIFAYLDTNDNVDASAVYMIDIPTGSMRDTFIVPGPESIGNVSFDMSGTLLAVSVGSSILFFDAAGGTQHAQLDLEKTVQEVAFCPNGDWLVVAYEGDNFNRSLIQFWGDSQ